MANKTVITEAAFIPEKWELDVIAVQEANLVMANAVMNRPMSGPGDTMQIPKPVRANASLKVANTDVNLLSATAQQLTVNIDRDFEYTVLYERITELQALASMQPFYTSDAGYALATAKDTDLHALGATLDGGTAYSNAVIGSDGTTAYTGANAAAITEAGFIDANITLDDANVPMTERSFVITPRTKGVMLQINNFISTDFVNNKPRVTGQLGTLHNVEVLVSTNCATTGSDRVCMLLHKDALVYAPQQSISVMQDIDLVRGGRVVSATTVYGVSQWQDFHALAVAVPA